MNSDKKSGNKVQNGSNVVSSSLSLGPSNNNKSLSPNIEEGHERKGTPQQQTDQNISSGWGMLPASVKSLKNVSSLTSSMKNGNSTSTANTTVQQPGGAVVSTKNSGASSNITASLSPGPTTNAGGVIEKESAKPSSTSSFLNDDVSLLESSPLDKKLSFAQIVKAKAEKNRLKVKKEAQREGLTRSIKRTLIDSTMDSIKEKKPELKSTNIVTKRGEGGTKSQFDKIHVEQRSMNFDDEKTTEEESDSTTDAEYRGWGDRNEEFEDERNNIVKADIKEPTHQPKENSRWDKLVPNPASQRVYHYHTHRRGGEDERHNGPNVDERRKEERNGSKHYSNRRERRDSRDGSTWSYYNNRSSTDPSSSRWR